MCPNCTLQSWYPCIPLMQVIYYKQIPHYLSKALCTLLGTWGKKIQGVIHQLLQFVSLFSSFHLATMNWSACHKYANWTIWRFWICPIITLNSWMVWRSSNFCHGLDWPITRSRLFSNWINVFILNIWICPETSSSIWTICPSSKISRYVWTEF